MKNSRNFNLIDITCTELDMALHLLRMTLNLQEWPKLMLKKWMSPDALNMTQQSFVSMDMERILHTSGIQCQVSQMNRIH